LLLRDVDPNLVVNRYLKQIKAPNIFGGPNPEELLGILAL